MNLVDIFTLWKAGDDIPDSNDVLRPEQIESYLKPRIRKNTIPLYINVVIYLCMHLVNIGVLSINIGIFRTNIAWLAATAGMLLISVAGSLLGIWILRNLSNRNTDLKLIDYIKTRINFFRRQYEVWLWFCSASAIILPLAINTYTDSIDGNYTINNIRLFITIFSVMFFGIYILNKISLIKILGDLNAYYTDLKNSALDLTLKKEAWMRKHRRLLIILLTIIMVVLVIFMILGIIRAGQS